jgi:hypothetical protein
MYRGRSRMKCKSERDGRGDEEEGDVNSNEGYRLLSCQRVLENANLRIVLLERSPYKLFHYLFAECKLVG